MYGDNQYKVAIDYSWRDIFQVNAMVVHSFANLSTFGHIPSGLWSLTAYSVITACGLCHTLSSPYAPFWVQLPSSALPFSLSHLKPVILKFKTQNPLRT